VNHQELEQLQDKYNKLKATVITTGFWKLTSSNIDRSRKLNALKKEIEIWNLKHQN
jgi:hypothetical protein